MRAMTIDLEFTGIQPQWIIGRVADAAGLCGGSADLGARGFYGDRYPRQSAAFHTSITSAFGVGFRPMWVLPLTSDNNFLFFFAPTKYVFEFE